MPGANALFLAMVEVILEHGNVSVESASESRPKNCLVEKILVLAGANGQAGQLAQRTAMEDLLRENVCVQEKVAAKEQMLVRSHAILTLVQCLKIGPNGLCALSLVVLVEVRHARDRALPEKKMIALVVFQKQRIVTLVHALIILRGPLGPNATHFAVVESRSRLERVSALVRVKDLM